MHSVVFIILGAAVWWLLHRGKNTFDEEMSRPGEHDFKYHRNFLTGIFVLMIVPYTLYRIFT